MALMVSGTILPMARGAEDASFAGQVWIGDDGRVAAVTHDGDSEPAGFAAAARLDLGSALVLPGMVDLHSHLAYNTLPLWAEPTQTGPYAHHGIWPDEATYGPQVSWTAWTLIKSAPECVFAYVQTRALAGGTTSIQGWPPASRPAANRLVRCVEKDQIGPLPDPVEVAIQTSTRSELADRLTGLGKGVFMYHCAEGQRGSGVAAEFHDLDTTGWLDEALVTIHACALEPADFDRWDAGGGRPSARRPGGTVVWSPFSNLWLYGQTTLVPEAISAGLAVALGTDWGPSGTRNLLGELKVARLWSDQEDWGLSDHDLVRMVTCAPGDVLGRVWDTPVGRLATGGLGDVTVIARTDPDPWRSVVEARERDVELVVMDGRAVYGRTSLLREAGERLTTSVPVGGSERRAVALVRPDNTTRAWAWSDVLDRLEQVRKDAAITPPSGPAAAVGGPLAADARVTGDPPGTPPFAVGLDMPGSGGEATAGPPPKGRTVDIAPIPPLYHDRRMMSFIRNNGFHGGALDDLNVQFGIAR